MALRTVLTQWYPPSSTLTESDLPDQSGKVFLVTGGSSGIGYKLCKMLYWTGATVYMTSRSESRATKAIAEIEASQTPREKKPGALHHIQLDLQDLASVKAAAEKFNAKEQRLDLLMHNAGTPPQQVAKSAKTAQGFEAMVGIHCVAPFVLTQQLLPRLRSAIEQSKPGSVRVIWISSISADMETPQNGIDFSTLDTGVKNDQQNYAVSKIGNWALAKEAARRYGSEGLVSVALNPGNFRTAMYQGLPTISHFLLSRLVLKDPKFGAYTELFASFSAEIRKLEYNGGYIIPFGRIRKEKE